MKVTYLLLCFCHSYTGHVVGNGLQAQKQNPEIKVRSVDPNLVNVKEKLEHFNKVGPSIYPATFDPNNTFLTLTL